MEFSRKDALDCFVSDDLIGLGMEADQIRRRLHPEGVVTYLLDGRVDYNLPFDAIVSRINEIQSLNATSLTLTGEVKAHNTLPWFETLFKSVRSKFPSLWLHSLSATEILTIARTANHSLQTTIQRLHDAGLDSIPGDDAAILDDDVLTPVNATFCASDWLEVHRTAHRLGINTTASILIGNGETNDHRINHLEAIRRLQEETGGFTSFTPSCLEPAFASAPGFEEATAVEYLKTLAISRIYLDNIPNTQSDLKTQGLKVLQVSLLFGGNDVGSATLAEGNNAATEEQLRFAIRDAGFRPNQRDTLFRTLYLN
jgi:cyclic dehypoxanthinyl futalosine synthase